CNRRSLLVITAHPKHRLTVAVASGLLIPNQTLAMVALVPQQPFLKIATDAKHRVYATCATRDEIPMKCLLGVFRDLLVPLANMKLGGDRAAVRRGAIPGQRLPGVRLSPGQLARRMPSEIVHGLDVTGGRGFLAPLKSRRPVFLGPIAKPMTAGHLKHSRGITALRGFAKIVEADCRVL